MDARQDRSFEVLSQRPLPEYRADATHLRHTATGCEILHLKTLDAENLFAFCFTTPPRDDTGVSHIIEHSVLSGSRRFPLKEPFSALMKGSMNTFLNALTYPDRTVYPAASCNRADFFNLLSVYGDAVFSPLLRKETFMQEAWRLEEAEEGGPNESASDGLRYAGVVYNEMKGAYSSPDSIVGEWAIRSLFPDTPYQFDSGGDPRFIPSLTLESARQFHARYYHPSNCRIFLYGNIPLSDILARLQDEFLSGFTAQSIDARIALQRRWPSPRRLEKTFPVKPQTPLEGRSIVTMTWLLPPVTDASALVLHEVLSEILIGSAGSPLRKRLVDSGLGEDLSPVSGLETDLQEMIFAAGLRATEPDREDRIVALILETLTSLASQGLDPRLVQSMINRVEFRHREIRGGGGPYALRLMGRALRGWIHGMDPIASLEFVGAMTQLKARLASDHRLLEDRILADLVRNSHRLTLVVRPDPEQGEREASEEGDRVRTAVSGLSPEEKGNLREEADRFRAYQLAPDTPEALALLPTLKRSDIPTAIERIPSEETRTRSGIPLSLHDIFTNEIIYLDLCFPTDSLSDEDALLLPLLGKAITGGGLPDMSYDQVALELYRLTGGFSSSLDSGGVVGRPGAGVEFAFFRMRCLLDNLPAAAALTGRLLFSADFRDKARLRDLLLEMRNDLKSALVPGGHQFAMLRAASRISRTVAREEQWRGVTQLLYLEEIAKDIDGRLPELSERLESVRSRLLSRAVLRVNATADRGAFKAIAEAAEGIAAALPSAQSPGGAGAAKRPAGGAPSYDGGAAPRGESLLSSAAVGYVATAVPGYFYDDPFNGPVAVLGHLLSTGYLWEKVRMEGGAYGAFSFPRNTDGLFLFGSYRDPKIVSTVRAFREGLARLVQGGVTEAEVDQGVIGTIGREDRPMDPGEKGFVSMQRSLHGIRDDLRQTRRDRLLATSLKDLSEAAQGLLAGFDRSFTAVIANRQSLDGAAEELPELRSAVVDLPE
ncbi:MAG TPA: insulinase family protein [Spirochaetia bacterium]|nr:insulinase family protein [Spirochaetia bacterium]